MELGKEHAEAVESVRNDLQESVAQVCLKHAAPANTDLHV